MDNICYGCDMSIEQWREVPWATDYQGSNYGRVRSLDRVVTCRNGNTRLQRGQIMKPNKNGQIQLTVNSDIIPIYVSNIIAELFIDKYMKGMPISFKDGDKTNCRLDNIIVGINNRATCNSINLTDIKTTNKIIDDIPVIAGGFGEGEKILFDITIANKIGKSVNNLRTANITPNLDNWEEAIDYINLMDYSNFNDFLPILLQLGYTSEGILKSEAIYIFSERGVAKLMSTLHNSNPAKWEFLNNFVNEYFNMREQIKNQTPQISERDLALLAIINSKSDVDQALAIKHYEEVVTQPLLETIEEQKPKVDKYDKLMESDGTYNATNSAKLLDIPTAQQFNKLLKDNKIQYKSGGNWVLTAKYQWLVDKGYCKYIEGQNTNYSYIQLRWYPKGIEWLRDNILNVT